jgi:hypothetical protein
MSLRRAITKFVMSAFVKSTFAALVLAALVLSGGAGIAGAAKHYFSGPPVVPHDGRSAVVNADPSGNDDLPSLVPESTSLLLLATGLFGLAAAARRRRKQHRDDA